MKAMRTLTLTALVLSAATLGTTKADEHPTTAEHPKSEHPTKAEHPKSEHPTKAEHLHGAGDIVAVVSQAGNFKMFVSVLKAANLTEALQGEGPFTVFAPTDEAFARLPEGTLENLLKPENKEMLAAIIAYHIVPGKIMAADVKTMKVKTVNDQELSITVEKGKVTVNEAAVVQVELAASNGVIQPIDTVMVPAVPAANPAAAKPKDHPGH